MSEALLAVAAAGLVAGTGLLVATTLRLRGLAQLLLGAYIVAFAEVVGLILFLSAFEAASRTAILVGVSVLFAATVACWLRLGAPRPSLAPLERLRVLARAPPLLALAIATGLALAYAFALVVGSPPSNWDSLAYHLARAAFWSQGDGIGYVAHAYDERLNVNPPNGEIALTFLLEVGRNERLTGFVQFAALLMLATGVYALARKLPLARGEAAFGALLFVTLPIVILQSSTTQNDLVAASFLVVAAVFLTGESHRELALAALATALALGTKVPAAYGIPILCVLGVVARPRALRMQRIAAVLVGAVAGSYWYAVNVVRTGHPLGDLPGETGIVAFLQPSENLFAAYARILDSLDLSGAIGADALAYLLIAIVVVVVLSLTAYSDRTRGILPALLTGALIVTPLVLVPVGYAAWHVFAKLHDVLEQPDRRLPVRAWEAQTAASDSLSWFGPLGFVLVVGFGVVAALLVRRGSLPPLALALDTAPLVSFLLISVSLAYDEWQGRFLVFPVALSASLWGLLLRIRRYAVAAVAIGATTAALSLVHFTEKPSGLALLERSVPASIWGAERWEVQSLLRPEMQGVLRFVEQELSTEATVALAVGEDDFAYPAFGAHLERHIELVPEDSRGRNVGEARWLLANPLRASEIDRSCWRLVHGGNEAWAVFRRLRCRR